MSERPKPFELTEAEYRTGCDLFEGRCLACRETADSVEPDAEHYKCQACGELQVFGLEQLLIMGLVEIVE